MPRHHLLAAGIDPDVDLRVAYSGAHDATALAVAGGRVAAGALNASVWDVAGGRRAASIPDELVVFFRDAGLPRLQLDGRPSGLDAATRRRDRRGLPRASRAEDPAQAEILAPAARQRVRADRAAATTPTIESAARAAGLID